MASDTSDLLFWLDMEMTGLDPVTCVPLEVAVVVTDRQLVERETYHSVVHQPEEALDRMIPFVREMHTGNGLLTRVRTATTILEEVDAGMAAFMARHLGDKRGVLAGNTIHQDRRFLEAYFPKTSKLLHYRMVDVSSLKELVRRWYEPSASYPKSKADHTAMADIRESIKELQHYRKMVFRDPAPKE